VTEHPRIIGALLTIQRTGECADRGIVAAVIAQNLVYSHNGKLKLTAHGVKALKDS
jgi:hypothetical protein